MADEAKAITEGKTPVVNSQIVEAVNAAIENCKQKNILRDYLEAHEKEVVKNVTMLFDQACVTEIALKASKREGREEGAYDTKIATARNLLALGLLSIEQIAQATGLSVEEVAAL